MQHLITIFSYNKGDDERFLMCDIGDVIEKVQRWRNLMPRIKIFYGMVVILFILFDITVAEALKVIWKKIVRNGKL
jgi:NADH:ubiquinone oxidoreductase subunit 3 (subunit A)